MYSYAGVAQLVRALPCHGRGCGFEPRLSRYFPDEVTVKTFWICLCLLCVKLYGNAADTPHTEQEEISSYACRQKIREMASHMRTEVEKIVRESVPGFFQRIQMLRKLYPQIDALEREGIACCKKGAPCLQCMEPLVQQMKVWDSKEVKDE